MPNFIGRILTIKVVKNVSRPVWEWAAKRQELWKLQWVRRLMWRAIAQSCEFDFQEKLKDRRSEDMFIDEASRLFEYLGYSSGQFTGKVIVDIGAGSEVMSRFFKGAKIVAIEPLASKFLTRLDSCGLKSVYEVHSVPGEKRVESLVGQADFAVSINVMDHCFDPAAVIKNMYDYLRVGSQALISVDCHTGRNPAHLVPISEDWLTATARCAGFTVEKVTRGLGAVYGDRKTGFGSSETINITLAKF